jgi:hypothetical protein
MQNMPSMDWSYTMLFVWFLTGGTTIEKMQKLSVKIIYLISWKRLFCLSHTLN